MLTLDTSGLVALINPNDRHRRDAVEVYGVLTTDLRHFPVVARGEGTITVLPEDGG